MGRLGATKWALLIAPFILDLATRCSIPLVSFCCLERGVFYLSNGVFMKKIIFLTALSCIGLTACSVMNSGTSHQPILYKENVKLVSYHFDDRFVHIEVISNGCTFISSFELLLVDKKSNSVEIIRKIPDNCRVKPIKISLNYAFRHLGVDTSRSVKLVNLLFDEALASVE